MSPLLPILAADTPPEIFGPIEAQPEGVTQQLWFWPVAAVAALALGLLILLLVVDRIRARKGKRKNPVAELRLRLKQLNGEAPNAAFCRELAAILREALGLCFDLSAAPHTTRELETLLADKDHFGRAASALDILRRCEAALFSGQMPEDAATLLQETAVALHALLPDENRRGTAQ